jgi:hypothetical protein
MELLTSSMNCNTELLFVLKHERNVACVPYLETYLETYLDERRYLHFRYSYDSDDSNCKLNLIL